jgi:osmoprotectant transport system permease protein
VEILAETAAWFLDTAHWTGRDGIPVRAAQHVLLSVASIVIAALVAVPVGLAIGHTRRAEAIVIGFANLGRALPSLAVLLIFLPFVGIGDPLAVVAMVALAIPPIVVNSAVGVREVDQDLTEAGRGMGMNEMDLLRRVELPIALPVILTGLRIAAVQVVATLTLGAVVAGGGLGRYIVDGLALRDEARLVAGALLVALLALLTERTFGFIERRSVSPGLAPRGASPAELAPPSAQAMVN